MRVSNGCCFAVIERSQGGPNIVAWGNVVPWADQRQVEQDLIISRAIVAIFSDSLLCQEPRFRGGTALNKLHFVPTAPVLRGHRLGSNVRRADRTNPGSASSRAGAMAWRAQFEQSPVAPKLRFRVDVENGAGTIRLKVENQHPRNHRIVVDRAGELNQ